MEGSGILNEYMSTQIKLLKRDLINTNFLF